jgi:hypothetical protein
MRRTISEVTGLRGVGVGRTKSGNKDHDYHDSSRSECKTRTQYCIRYQRSQQTKLNWRTISVVMWLRGRSRNDQEWKYGPDYHDSSRSECKTRTQYCVRYQISRPLKEKRSHLPFLKVSRIARERRSRQPIRSHASSKEKMKPSVMTAGSWIEIDVTRREWQFWQQWTKQRTILVHLNAILAEIHSHILWTVPPNCSNATLCCMEINKQWRHQSGRRSHSKYYVVLYSIWFAGAVQSRAANKSGEVRFSWNPQKASRSLVIPYVVNIVSNTAASCYTSALQSLQTKKTQKGRRG